MYGLVPAVEPLVQHPGTRRGSLGGVAAALAGQVAGRCFPLSSAPFQTFLEHRHNVTRWTRSRSGPTKVVSGVV